MILRTADDAPEGPWRPWRITFIALLIALWNTRDKAEFLTADWALAATAYDRFATGPDTVGRGTQHMVRITLDDGAPVAQPEPAGTGSETGTPDK